MIIILNIMVSTLIDSILRKCSCGFNQKEHEEESIIDKLQDNEINDIKQDIKTIKENHLHHIEKDINELKMDVKLIHQSLLDIKIKLG